MTVALPEPCLRSTDSLYTGEEFYLHLYEIKYAQHCESSKNDRETWATFVGTGQNLNSCIYTVSVPFKQNHFNCTKNLEAQSLLKVPCEPRENIKQSHVSEVSGQIFQLLEHYLFVAL